jgi:hypothetical protein
MEQTATVATGLDVARLLKSDSLSASMRANLQRADVDNDGIVDVEELLKILESESALRRERKLLRRIVMALGVACILIVAAVVGLTYAVVHLSKDTSVQNNVLVSKKDSQPLSTGGLRATYPLKDWYKVTSMSELEGLTQITVPFGDGLGMFQIQEVHLIPNESIRFVTSSENVSITVSESGISVTGDEKNSSATRRRLMSEEPEGTVSGQVLGRSTVEGTKECSGNDECDSWNCTGLVEFSGIVIAKGTCAPKVNRLSTWSACTESSQCTDGDECKFATADESNTKVCCRRETGPSNSKYCPGNTGVGQKCFGDFMCVANGWRTYCKGSSIWKAEGICTEFIGRNGPCDENEDCKNSACGRPTADDDAALVCCPSGATSTYGGYDYCTGMAVGATCWADDQCQSGKCKGNGGGTQKGSCSSVTKAVGEACDSNYECANKACGRSTADDGAKLVCCESGATSTYGGYDYCTGMAVGATCWADDQCQSKYCQGNGGGLQRGKCQSTSKSKGESCSKDEECGSKACGRQTAADNAPLVCCDALESWAGYDYCNNMPAGSVCWSDDQCVSSASNCKGNGYGVQRGICS